LALEASETLKLSEEQALFFHREGYLVLDQVTSSDEIEMMREVYDRLFASDAGQEAGDRFDLGGVDDSGPAKLPQILKPEKYAPELASTTARKNALAVARQLLGDDAEALGDHAILKPARSGAPTPWHQDEAYWDPALEYTAISVWIPLQDATLENGCMQFIPRSHLLDVLPHHSIDNDPRIHGLEVDGAIETEAAVACPTPAGGATIHLSRTLHYAGPNLSAQPRRAYIMAFQRPPRQRSVPRSFYWNEEKTDAYRLKKQKL
jgi:ectoine hydroxylase-related dioxygenase (phytanoyl-CoA dioxygenase family)